MHIEVRLSGCIQMLLRFAHRAERLGLSRTVGRNASEAEGLYRWDQRVGIFPEIGCFAYYFPLNLHKSSSQLNLAQGDRETIVSEHSCNCGTTPALGFGRLVHELSESLTIGRRERRAISIARLTHKSGLFLLGGCSPRPRGTSSSPTSFSLQKLIIAWKGRKRRRWK